MTLLEAFALGVLQGATEFLPVSSSGHLALAHYLFPAESSRTSMLLFDLVVHLGTLGAIVAVLRHRVRELLVAGLSLVPGLGVSSPDVHRRWLWLLIAGSVPTALLGLTLRGVVEQAHARPVWLGAAWLATAAILWLSERLGQRDRGADSLGLGDALLVGCAQGLAVLPGISRSGATVGAALLRGVGPEAAVEFSMLLSIPAIVGANLYEFARSDAAAVGADLGPLSVGFAAALVVGAAALKALQWAVRARRLSAFAVYCALLGVGAMFLG